MSKNVLMISRNDIIKRTIIGGNIDPEKIIPHVKVAQDKYMLIILGSVLYNKIQSDIVAGTLSGVYKTLVDDYVVDTLVHYSMVEALPFLAYTIANGGIQKHISEQGESVSKNEIDFLLEKSLQSAQFYSERLVRYLIAHNASYPEYTQTTGFSDTVFPDKGSQYTVGWVF